MKILSIPITIIYYFFFGLTLLFMHGWQWLAYNLGGYKSHHFSVKVMNFVLIGCTKILGTSHQFSSKENLPLGVPLIFVSNHQSMLDISPIEWYLSEFHPKFISKIELGKGIPSVSYNLQRGGSALIDRKDSRQALPEIKKLAELVQNNNYSVVIFPEGTRSRDGKLKHFHENGLKMLLKFAPSALIVPLTINNSWKIVRNGNFPLSLGVRFSLQVHQPFSPKDMSFEELLEKTREAIQSTLETSISN